MSVSLAPVNPEVIRSRMAALHYQPEAIARRLGIKTERLHQWLERRCSPTVRRAQQLSKVLLVPYGYLLLERPPELHLPVEDLRVGPRRQQAPSAELLEVVWDAQRKSEWYSSVLEELGTVRRAIPALPLEPDQIREEASRRIGVEECRSQSSSLDDFFRRLCERLQDLGVIVLRSGTVGFNTRRKLDPQEFRGFSLSSESAPVIFINARDYRGAQLFTLVHEFVHLLMGKSALSDIAGEAELVSCPGPDRAREAFCNRAAAEILAPAHMVRGVLGRDLGLAVFERAARELKVSTSMLLVRARELGLISRGDFTRLRESAARLVKPPRPGRAPLAERVFAHNSRLVVETLIARVQEGKERYTSAAALLGLSLPGFIRFLDRETGRAQ